jgi:hypothetical protein
MHGIVLLQVVIQIASMVLDVIVTNHSLQ